MRLIQEKKQKKTEELKSSSTATGDHMQGWDIKKASYGRLGYNQHADFMVELPHEDMTWGFWV